MSRILQHSAKFKGSDRPVLLDTRLAAMTRLTFSEDSLLPSHATSMLAIWADGFAVSQIRFPLSPRQLVLSLISPSQIDALLSPILHKTQHGSFYCLAQVAF